MFVACKKIAVFNKVLRKTSHPIYTIWHLFVRDKYDRTSLTL